MLKLGVLPNIFHDSTTSPPQKKTNTNNFAIKNNSGRYLNHQKIPLKGLKKHLHHLFCRSRGHGHLSK